MKKFVFSFCLFLCSNLGFPQWNDISIKSTSARIYDLDAHIRATYETVTIDALSAVGWNYTSGFLYFSTNGGRKWDTLLTASDFFPFAVKFLPTNKILLAGYNYVQDEANVYIYDELTRQSLVFYFDGNSFPYCKNLFDISLVSSSLFVCGYNGKIFRWSLVENHWEEMQTTSNLVFVQIKVTETILDSDIVMNGYALAGKLFDHPNQMFRLNTETNEWMQVFDFSTLSESFIVTSFDIFVGDSLHPFSLLVVGTANDTIKLYKSTDYGYRWDLVFQLTTLNSPVGVSHGRISYFIDDAGNIWKSKDYGTSWYQNHYDSLMDFYRLKVFTTSVDTANFRLEPIFLFGFGNSGKIKIFESSDVLTKEEPIQMDFVFEFAKIYDILGNEIMEIASESQLNKFFEGCSNGLYLMYYSDSSRTVRTRKVIKANGKILIDYK